MPKEYGYTINPEMQSTYEEEHKRAMERLAYAPQNKYLGTNHNIDFGKKAPLSSGTNITEFKMK